MVELSVAELVAIPASDLDAMWPQIGAQMDELAKTSRGRLTAKDIARAVRERDMQLWCAVDGEARSLMTTQLLNFPQVRECRLVGAQGQNAERWLDLWPMIETWAIANGCALISAECRPGWKRLLGRVGMGETALVLEKML